MTCVFSEAGYIYLNVHHMRR